MELSELVSRVKRGDKAALAEIVRIYGGDVYTRALSKTQDKVIAQQVTRQMITELVEKLRRHPDMDGYELWLEALSEKNLAARCDAEHEMRRLSGQMQRELMGGDDDIPIYTAAVPQPEPPPVRTSAPSRNSRPDTDGAFDSIPAQSAPASDPADTRRTAPVVSEYPAGSQAMPVDPPIMPVENERHDPSFSGAEPRTRAQTAPAPAAPQQLFRPKRRHLFLRALGIFALSMLCLLLLWFILGMLMRMSIVPPVDLGYVWFNEHIYLLF